MLFGEIAAERAKETGASERTLHYQATLFEQEGMRSLFHKERSPSPEPGRSLPPEMCQLIVNLKAEYPGFSLREISTICFLRFGRKLSHHTVQRVLADGPKPTVTGRRYPPYAQIADPYQRRRAIVDLHAEGWSHTAISAYLQTPRHRVYEVLKRWARLGHARLDDTPQRHAHKTGIREIHEVGKLVVESPELGAYRVRAALEQIGIHLSQATCGRLLALNRKLYGERGLPYAPVTVWVYDGSLKVEYQAVTLSTYRVELQDRHKHLRAVSHPRLADTSFRSPQLMLIDLGPHEWLLYWKTPEYAPAHRKRRIEGIVQLPLFDPQTFAKAVGADERRGAPHPRTHLHLVPKLSDEQDAEE